MSDGNWSGGIEVGQPLQSWKLSFEWRATLEEVGQPFIDIDSALIRT